ncbi:MAG: shikimate dehydrogenase [Actinomycetota bacterium]|nr:MAG: shikimate [Actinomycetota bacterium]MDO8949319.1 shikimate dehydrogenase [Actinomycetota bacterium]MDP3630701.1 shikimate dehydrogenase [Actinomycetota bacterium]
MRIDGRTRLAGVVGWPVEHSLSPAMHNAAYEELDLNWVYLALPAPDQGALFRLADAARSSAFVGFNVTMPHKRAVLELCDEVAMLAQMAGAVNTVHCVEGRLVGYNTDSRGLLESLQAEAQFNAEGRRIAIIGAGGAAGAAVAGFILGKATHLSIVNRDVARAEQLMTRVEPYLRGLEVSLETIDAGAEQAVREADLVINATPLGMKVGDASPIPVEWFRPDQVVYDMVYLPTDTAFLEGARLAGARALGGLGMLVAQGALAVDIWTENPQQRAPREVMRTSAEDAISRLASDGETS